MTIFLTSIVVIGGALVFGLCFFVMGGMVAVKGTLSIVAADVDLVFPAVDEDFLVETVVSISGVVFSWEG